MIHAITAPRNVHRIAQLSTLLITLSYVRAGRRPASRNTDMSKEVKARLRDPASWLPLAGGGVEFTQLSLATIHFRSSLWLTFYNLAALSTATLRHMNEAKSVAGNQWLRLSPSVALLRGQVWSALKYVCNIRMSSSFCHYCTGALVGNAQSCKRSLFGRSRSKK